MDIDYKFKYIKNSIDLNRLIKYCKQTGYASIDFETTGVNATYPGGKPTILGVSFQPGSAYIIPLAHKESPFKNNWKEILIKFGKAVIEDPHIVKIAQNLKFEYNWFKKYGIIMAGRLFDTMLAKYLLDEERPHGLKSLVTRFLPEFDGYDLPGQPGPKAERERIIEFWSNVPLEPLSKYCALDCDLTFRLWVFFERRLIDNGFYPLFRNMLMMATRVLAEAESYGMSINREYLEGLVDIYADKINKCETRIRSNEAIVYYEKHKLKTIKKKMVKDLKIEIEELEEEGGREIMIKNREAKISRYLAGDFQTNKEKEKIAPTNFSSPAQMIDLLFTSEYGFEFDIVKYTTDKKTKKETDRPSTDEEVLEELNVLDDSGFITNLLELRATTKMNSTYVVGMLDKVTSKDKIHGSFLLHGTVTGRLSSREPNLQNIPRSATNSDIKKMFIHPKDMVILQMDYSQAELRVLAAAAKEEMMIHWFKIGRDIHLASACLKWGEEYDDIIKIYKDDKHPEQGKWAIRRKQAKTINFGIVYGQTAKKLSIALSTDDHKVSQLEAQKFLDDFNEQFPAVAKYIKRQQRSAEKKEYVYNLFGRKRRLPNANSDSWGKKAEALRQSVNAPIQGAASDFTLFTSILIRERIRSGELPKSLVQVGTVHDSLIFYIKPEDIHETIPKLYEVGRNPETKTWFNFEVKGVEMAMDFEVSYNWGTLKGYNKNIDYIKTYDNYKELNKWLPIYNK